MNQLNPLLLDIKSWIYHYHHFAIKHIYREANKVVDFVAKCAHNGDCSWTVVDYVLIDLEFFLHADKKYFQTRQ